MNDREVELLFEHLQALRQCIGYLGAAIGLLAAVILLMGWFIVDTHFTQCRLRNLLDRLDQRKDEKDEQLLRGNWERMDESAPEG